MRRGFTLLEMSMVMVVIALVIGGVVMGRELIRNAERQSVITDVGRFKKAMKLFKEKYKYLPGDLPNATSLWGADTGCTAASIPNTDATAANTTLKTSTCGGDGNGFIGGMNSSNTPYPAWIGLVYRESLRAWQHLANAKLIKGTYTGAPHSTGGNTYFPDINVPASAANVNDGYIVFHSPTVDVNGLMPGGIAQDFGAGYPGDYGHIIEYARVRGQQVDAPTAGSALSGADALSIDQKVDDGRPATGAVRTLTPNSQFPDCATSADPDDAEYTTAEGLNCMLIFITGL